MSASDSGVVVLAAPVVVAVGAVSLAAAGITAAARAYKQNRYNSALANEIEKKAELDFISRLSEENRLEYERILDARVEEEIASKSREEKIQDSALEQLRNEIRERERIKAEIDIAISEMDTEIGRFEAQFGESAKLRDMADTIRRSQELFGNGEQLMEELSDLLTVIIPAMTEEMSEKKEADRLKESFDSYEADHYKVVDSSQEFVSLDLGADTGAKGTVTTPWERFVRRLQAVAAVEGQYFETEAADMLAEAQTLEENRRNFYIQQHEQELSDMEERAAGHKALGQSISEKTMEAYNLYMAIVEKLGVEPRFFEDELHDAYVVQEMREETEDLVEEYKKVKERQYTVNAFTQVMKRHNLTFENMTVHGSGMETVEYSMDEETGVRIARSSSGAFEMQFQGHTKGASATLDEERRITEKAQHFCSILPKIKEELEEEFGITFEQTSLQPPSLSNIEISQSDRSQRVEKARTKKAMEMK